METSTTAPTRTARHHDRVRLQRRVHQTRQLLLQAADQLLDVDLAVRGDDPARAERALERAAQITAAAQYEICTLDPHPDVTITLS